MEIISIKGGGGPTLNGKSHFKFPFCFSDYPLKWIAAVWHCWEFLTGPQFIALLKVIRQPKSDTGQQLLLLRCFFYRGGPLDQPLFQISLRANLFKALNYISSSSCNDGVKPAWCLPTYKKVFTTKDENLEPKITISTLPLRMPKRRLCHLQNLAVVVWIERCLR